MTLDLDKFQPQTADYYKWEEMPTKRILKDFNIAKPQIYYVGELNSRFAPGFFIPSLFLIASFLLISNKDFINPKFLKTFVFLAGFFVIILSDLLPSYSFKYTQITYLTYFLPITMGFILYFFLIKIFEKENKN